MKKSTVIAALATLALVASLAWFLLVLKPRMIAQYIASQPRPVPTVATIIARRQPWQEELGAVATLSAAQGVDVAAEVGGKVAAILFESGQAVAAGAALLRLEDDVLRAELAEARTEFENAAAELARAASLAQRRTLSQSVLDAARARRDRAGAAVQRMQARLDQKLVRAPFAGRLGVRLVMPGQYLRAGTPIVTLQALDPIHANFAVPEQSMPRLAAGQQVLLEVGSHPGTAFPALITALDPKVDEQTRTVRVQASAANADGRLLPGQFANARILLGEPTDRIVVREEAVVQGLYGDSVFVVAPAGADPRRIARQRPVRLGPARAGEVVILEGVAAGEEVVVAGQFKLQGEAPVQINNAILPGAPAERPRS
ncbi:MAG: efflux RND transporter periplasmic adaptor subunit [Gammaproteobacteria bacterium]